MIQMYLKLSLEDQIQMLPADVDAINFYKSMGFERPEKQCLCGFMPEMSIDTLNSDRSS